MSICAKSSLYCWKVYIIYNTYSIIELNKNAVDPDSISKDDRYSSEFKVEIHFNGICSKCVSTEPLDKLCDSCKDLMKDEMGYW